MTSTAAADHQLQSGAALAADLPAGRLLNFTALQQRFALDSACLPSLVVQLTPLATYEGLLDNVRPGDGA